MALGMCVCREGWGEGGVSISMGSCVFIAVLEMKNVRSTIPQ